LFKRLLIDYLKTGCSDDKYDENNRKIFILNLFALVGMSITGVMSLIAFYNANYTLAIVLLVASFIYFLARFIQLKIKNHVVSSSVVLYSLYILMFYLIYSGGANNTGPLWIFMVAPVSLFLHGLKVGLIELGVFVLIISILLFTPDNALLATTYTEDFKTRLVYSFLTTTFLSAFYEYSRHKSYVDLTNLSIKYKALSKFDPLTHLPNRREALNKIEFEQNRLNRNQSSLCVILCDIDFFKKINDRYGHDAGDFVLVELSKLFLTIIRKQDLVARWGGEEFLFLLPDTDKAGAQIFTKKLHEVLSSHYFEFQNKSLQITVSMGVSEVTSQQDIEQNITLADENLYKAKHSGRNQTVI